MTSLCLLDTSVLIRVWRADGVSLSRLGALGELCLVPQCLYEAWVVMTRPVSVNGFGFSPLKAHTVLRELLRDLEVIPDSPLLAERWLSLVHEEAVSGKAPMTLGS